MSKDVMIAIMMSLVNYIIVNTISSKNSAGTENLIKFLLGETKQEIITEIKEQGQFIRDTEGKE